MELERFKNWGRDAVEIAESGAREPHDAIGRGWALAAWLVAFAITLVIATSLLHALQIAIRDAGGAVEVFPQPETGEQQDRAREPLERETDSVIADTLPAQGRMFATEEASQWSGSDSAPARRIVF